MADSDGGASKEDRQEELVEFFDENDGLLDEAEDVLVDLSVEFVSAVDTPAQPSEWLVLKNAESDKWGVQTPFVFSKNWGSDAEKDNEEKQIAFAPVLIPDAVDKQGDVVPPSEIEEAAHNYLKNHGKVDTDHDLKDGKGTPVESYTLKTDREFELPDGTSKEYPAGTWVLGIEFVDDAWERVKDGELNGLSIYGQAASLDPEQITESTKSMTESETESEEVDTEEEVKEESETESEETTSKQMAADTVSAMLDAFEQYISNTDSSPSSVTVEEFVEWALDQGDFEEGEVGGVDVFDTEEQSSSAEDDSDSEKSEALTAEDVREIVEDVVSEEKSDEEDSETESKESDEETEEEVEESEKSEESEETEETEKSEDEDEDEVQAIKYDTPATSKTVDADGESKGLDYGIGQ